MSSSALSPRPEVQLNYNRMLQELQVLENDGFQNPTLELTFNQRWALSGALSILSEPEIRSFVNERIHILQNASSRAGLPTS